MALWAAMGLVSLCVVRYWYTWTYLDKMQQSMRPGPTQISTLTYTTNKNTAESTAATTTTLADKSKSARRFALPVTKHPIPTNRQVQPWGTRSANRQTRDPRFSLKIAMPITQHANTGTHYTNCVLYTLSSVPYTLPAYLHVTFHIPPLHPFITTIPPLLPG